MRKILIPFSVVALGAIVSACGTAPMGPLITPATEPLAWVRTDGQSGRANPALVDQFAADRAACGVTASADNFALRAAEPCMSARGYVLVPASQAEATAAQFRARAGYATPNG
jgi:hypothetical protein